MSTRSENPYTGVKGGDPTRKPKMEKTTTYTVTAVEPEGLQTWRTEWRGRRVVVGWTATTLFFDENRKGTHVAIAVAICNPKDAYSKPKGRLIVAQRLWDEVDTVTVTLPVVLPQSSAARFVKSLFPQVMPAFNTTPKHLAPSVRLRWGVIQFKGNGYEIEVPQGTP